MNALDSPLEAPALNYLTYGFQTAVNSIWGWIVVTAAVSFWSIRALSSPPMSMPPEVPIRSHDAASTSSPPPPEVAEIAAEKPAFVCTSGESEVQLLSAPTKTKFSLHYEEDGLREVDDGRESDGDKGCRAVAMGEKFGGWCDDWERRMVMRIGDMGWYRWQDTAALDGSVVRLWDGCRRRHAVALLVDGGGAW